MLLVLLSFLAFAGPIPKVLPAYFNGDDFADCLANELAKEHDLKSLDKRLGEISKKRNALASAKVEISGCGNVGTEICRQFGFPLLLGKAIDPLSCALTKLVEKNLVYHSMPLVECSGYVPSKTPFLYYLMEWQTLSDNEKRNLNEVDALSEISSVPRQTIFKSESNYHACVHDKAEPLVKWLLQQKPNSVSHWQVFKKAKELYGDSLTALGIIGELFDEERRSCTNRKRRCVLGNRLKPLFPSDQSDKVGHNYHFWAHISVVLQEDGISEDLANYLLEWKKDNDAGDYSANNIGIKVSRKTISRTKMKLAPLNRWTGHANSVCKLD
jgi:hypothetical protein